MGWLEEERERAHQRLQSLPKWARPIVTTPKLSAHTSNKHRKKKMDIKTAHRKIFEVEYVEVTADNIDEVAAWVGSTIGGEGETRHIPISDKTAFSTRQRKAFIGDFVTHYVPTGSFKSFTRTAFINAFDTDIERIVHRDAGDGRFVTEAQAEADPDGTVTEHVGTGEK